MAKVDPARHVLRHKKKDLDLTLSVRFANLPAGALLELAKIDEATAAARKVNIALQLESGVRVQRSVGCGSTLLAVLEAFAPDCGPGLLPASASNGTPCLTWMNKAFEGHDVLART